MSYSTDLSPTASWTRRRGPDDTGVDERGGRRGVPGVEHGWVPGGVYTGYYPAGPRLRLISIKLRLIGSYGRLTEIYLKYTRSEISGI